MISESIVSDHIFHDLRKGRSGSINEEDDFLPRQQEFSLLNRDRAFSWDVTFEEGIHYDSAVTAYHQNDPLFNPTILVKGNSIIIKEESTRIISDGLNKTSELKVALKLSITESDQHTVTDETFPETSCNLEIVDESLVDIFPLEADHLDHIPHSAIKVESHLLTSIEPKSTGTRSASLSSSIPKPTIRLPEADITASRLSFCDTCDDRKVGVYTKEERRQRIEKFRQKKMNRIWKKQIKYDCRKRLADTRPRVKGRFVSRSSPDQNDSSDHVPHQLQMNGQDSFKRNHYPAPTVLQTIDFRLHSMDALRADTIKKQS